MQIVNSGTTDKVQLTNDKLDLSTVSVSQLISSGTVVIGSGATPIKYIQAGSFSLDPGNVLAVTGLDQTVAVSGLQIGDVCSIQAAALETNLIISSMGVPSTGNIKVRFVNPTALAIDPASQSFSYQCIRF